ncbi:MAG: PilN domain-containing protein [Nitrospirae bacterium]|nr:PilN domain-containing protein [Nitrospirota bacterium]
MRVAGISFENYLLRISVVDKKIGVIKPVKSEDISLPVSEQERTAVIKETFQKLKKKYNTDKIVVGLAFNNFSHHIIEIPLSSRTDIRNAMFYELEKYLPLPPEEYIYDFSILERAQKRTRNLVFSIRKDRMNWLLNIVRDSGLNILAVRCSFIEAVNEFISTGKVKDAVFIYAAEDAYYIAVLKDQRPVQFRVVLKGKNIVAEVEKLAESYGSIYIAGTPEPDIRDKLNVKTFPLSLPNSVALSVLRRSGLELNFMPAGFLPKKKDYYPYAIGAMTVLSVMLYFFTAVYSYYKDYSALRNVEKKIERIKSKASGFLDERKKMESVYEKKKFLYDFQRKKNLNIEVLTELSRILPMDIWLTAMSVDENGKVGIEGFAKRAASIIEPLSKSKFFTKVEFASPIVLQNGQEKFSIKMEVSE